MTEAGWYEDPERLGRGRRYWDGSQWTEHYEHPAQAPAQQAPAQAAPVQAQQAAPAQALPPAGWKDDPEGGPGMRYWDGSQWTDHYHPPREGGAAQQPAAGGFQPASQAFQPAGEQGQAPAAAPAPAQRQTSSLDETQLDVRGYHGGRPEDDSPTADSAVPAAPAAAAAAAATPEAAAASEAPAEEIDYGTAGDPATCDSCSAKIRSSHKYCPACGVKQAATS